LPDLGIRGESRLHYLESHDSTQASVVRAEYDAHTVLAFELLYAEIGGPARGVDQSQQLFIGVDAQ
jgi:hypothetical protein